MAVYESLSRAKKECCKRSTQKQICFVYQAVQPPSTTIFSPVVKVAISEIR